MNTQDGEGTALVRKVIITNMRGLHARASAKFVKRAAEFDAQLMISREGMQVVGTSIMGLMMLGAAKGSSISIEASGPQGAEALAAIIALIEAKFDED